MVEKTDEQVSDEEIIEKVRNVLEDEYSLNMNSCYFITKKLNEDYWEEIKEEGDSEEIEDEVLDGEEDEDSTETFEDDEDDKNDKDDILEATPTVKDLRQDQGKKSDKKLSKNN